MPRHKNTLGRVLAYHGCEYEIARQLINHDVDIAVSANKYDWLGDGAYFWIDSPQRAIDWALWKRDQGEIRRPAIVGAFINLGLCLNLTDYGVMTDIGAAHEVLRDLFTTAGAVMPQNTLRSQGTFLKRFLDCAVFNMVHKLRTDDGKEPYDTVLGIFEEGSEVYQDACFKEKTHIQVAVRNPECIVGYFQVRGQEVFK
jgi:hypothetical protein